MPLPAEALVIHQLFDRDALEASCHWQPLREGVDISFIYHDENEGPQAAFLRYQPGARIPTHAHLGLEHILILHGSQEDGDKTYAPGSLAIHPAGTRHQIYSPEGCLALGFWQRPVQFVQ